jgi:hypothetical protein
MMVWLDFLLSSQLGLTRESLFEILARSKTRILDPKISRHSRETCESKLVARLADRNFVVRIVRSVPYTGERVGMRPN